jgi:hypothetical protein
MLSTQAGLIRSLILALISLPVTSDPVIDLKLKAGLGAQAVTGRTTELEIRLFTTTPFDGELQILDYNGLSTLPIYLEERKQQSIWLPVIPLPDGPIRVRLKSNGSDIQEHALAFEQSPSPLTIISGAIPGENNRDNYQWLEGLEGTTPAIISTLSLPHTPQAYDSVDAVIAKASLLTGLSHNQYSALGSYLKGCGIMLLSAEMKSVLERLRDVSGCSGKFVQRYDNLSQIPTLLLELMKQRLPPPPSPHEMVSLQNTSMQSATVKTISLYLGGYLVFIALMTWRGKRLHYLMLIPLLVAGAAILVWSGKGSHRVITWAESQSGNSHTRVSSLLLLGGNRRGESRIKLQSDARLINLTGTSRHSGILYQDLDSEPVLYGHTDLLVPQTYLLSSVWKLSPQFRITIQDGIPEIVFLGKGSPEDTRLLWRGQAYSIPNLTIEDRWRPDASQGQPPENNEERLLNRRLAYDDPALLLPFTPDLPVLSGSEVKNRGWLVIRPATNVSL